MPTPRASAILGSLPLEEPGVVSPDARAPLGYPTPRAWLRPEDPVHRVPHGMDKLNWADTKHADRIWLLQPPTEFPNGPRLVVVPARSRAATPFRAVSLGRPMRENGRQMCENPPMGPARRTYHSLRLLWRSRVQRRQSAIQRSIPLEPEDRSGRRRRMHVLVDLVHERIPGVGLCVVAVGTRTGPTARHIARYCPQVEEVFAVDLETPAEEAFDGLDRVTFIQGDSPTVAKDFEDDSVDLVFLDADPHEESVLQNLEAWSPKVRGGGIIAGHGYGSKRHVGVTVAVDRVFRNHRHPVQFDANKVWWTSH